MASIPVSSDRSVLNRILPALAGRSLMIAAALVVVSLFAVRSVRAQVGVFYGTWSAPGGGIAVGAFTVVTIACPKFPPSESDPNYHALENIWETCDERWLKMKATGIPDKFIPAPPPQTQTSGGRSRRAARLSAQANASPSFDLTSSVPELPFLGNWLVTLGYLPNNPNPVDATAAYSVALRRGTDCSLTEDILDTSATTPNAGVITSLTSAQDYFHILSGLSTTPDVFANSCGSQYLGLPSTNVIILLGTTSDGAAISATLSNSGQLMSEVTDTTANTFATHAVASNVNGGFAAADLNGDGNIDLVATFVTDPATSLPATGVFLGNGDGTFKAGVYYDVPGDVTIDDVTGDGKPDIVVLTNPGITTLTGKGDGTFTVGTASATSRTFFGQAPGQVLTGDFNGDGKKDVLAEGTVYLGAGNGTFTAGSPVTANTSFNFTTSIPSVAVGSLRNNGKLDVAISQEGVVAIFYGNGDGTFTAGPLYAALPDFEQLVITDIDGDGNPDIFLGTGTDGIYASGGYDIEPAMSQILMGRGDGTFVDSQVYNQAAFSSQTYGNTGQQVAGGDFNGDMKNDVLVRTPYSLIVLPGDGAGNLGTPITSTPNVSPSLLVGADMNGDQKLDVVVAGNSNMGPAIGVLLNQGNGSFAQEADYAIANTPISLAVGDFNGDGLMDVAVGVATFGGGGVSGVFVLLGQANGTLGAPTKIDSSVYPTGLAVGDLNGDKRSDLLVADEGVWDPSGTQQVNGALHVYLGNSSGTFTAPTSTPTTSASNYSVAGLVDLNNDGKLDLVVAGNVIGDGTTTPTSTANLYTLLGNGDGTFQTATTFALAGQDGIGATSLAFLDVNKDGNPDVLLGNPNDNTELLVGNGDGTLIDTALALGQRPLAVSAADLNGDGLPELFVGQTSSVGGNLAVFINTNDWVALSGASTQTTVASSQNPSAVGQEVTFTATVTSTSGTGTPTGSVMFLDNGTSIGSGTLSSGQAALMTSSLTEGTHPITVQYSGDSNFTGSTSATLSQVVNAATLVGTTTTLASSANPAAVGASITLAATVKAASGSTVPTGSVTFLDSATMIGSGTLGSTGQATMQTGSLAAGSHSLTAQYLGDTTFSGSTSAVLTQTVGNPTFTITGTAVTVTPGPIAMSTITVTPAGGFTGSVALAAAITTSPSGAQSPPTVSFGAANSVSITGTSAGKATLQIGTTPGGCAPGNLIDFRVPWYPAGGAALACLLLLGIALERRNRWRMLATLALLATLVGAMLACGGGTSTGTSNCPPATTAGNYVVTVTGTSGSTTATGTVTITVQ